MSSTPSVAELQAYSEEVQALYKKLPNLRDLPDNKVNETAALEQDVKNLDVKEQTRLTDKIAKESSDSTASSHDNHAEGGNLLASAHNSKGPAIPDNMPKAESKEDLKKRAEELNK
ncbi:uncharacterized protein J4E87_002107 [Alternaria ethzedia]|uniref:uncharacterized protein n=1 Tax=Alternaria ethzedia TaxID=181014 RepID=UPI0020C4B148|nr:uncharacterized protein J4E87_002107 [Alternaria ethzedia]KAI4632633.1 hypothetical protein J4E87_002107 [Alternaria ethzedia]